MPNVRQLTPEYWAARLQEWQNEFPGAKFGWPADAKPKVLKQLKAALRDGGEEAIQTALTANPYLIQYAIDHSGHHGTWVFPKQMIKPSAPDGSSGLVPDYLVATRSSLGYFWHVVELKRFDVQFANSHGTGYSGDGNKAIAQCNSYLAHFREYIDTIRSHIRVDELVQPEGAILLIGDSKSETEAQRRCRADFVHNNPKIKVVSYRRIVNGLEADLKSRKVE